MNSELFNYMSQIVFLAFSVFATWYFAMFYYKKANKITSLQISMHYFSDLITLEETIKDEIRVFYKKKKINNLKLIQFLVVNDGTEPIKITEEPLILHIPIGYKVLKTHIAKAIPEGRIVKINDNINTNIEIYFPLLNQEEGFLLEVIMYKLEEIISNDKSPDFKFTLTSENLPPQIIVKDETFGGYLKSAFYDTLKPISNAIIYILKYLLIYTSSAGIFMILLLLLIALKIDNYNLFNFIEFFSHFDFWSLIILISAFVSIPFLIVSIGIIIGWITKKKDMTPPFEKNYYKVFQDKLRKW